MRNASFLQAAWAFVMPALPAIRFLAPDAPFTKAGAANANDAPSAVAIDNVFTRRMAAKNLDSRTIARRMDLARKLNISYEREVEFFNAIFMNKDPDMLPRPDLVAAFCRETEILPHELFAQKPDELPAFHVIEASIIYNLNYLSIGHDRVTDFLVGICQRARRDQPIEYLGDKASAREIMDMVVAVGRKLGVSRQGAGNRGAVMAYDHTMRFVANVIGAVHDYGLENADVGRGRPAFPFHIKNEGVSDTPVFIRTDRGIALQFQPNWMAGRYRFHASRGWMIAVQEWVTSEAGQRAVKLEAMRHYIQDNHFGLRSQAVLADVVARCRPDQSAQWPGLRLTPKVL